jgi:hypothetical protein
MGFPACQISDPSATKVLTRAQVLATILQLLIQTSPKGASRVRPIAEGHPGHGLDHYAGPYRFHCGIRVCVGSQAAGDNLGDRPDLTREQAIQLGRPQKNFVAGTRPPSRQFSYPMPYVSIFGEVGGSGVGHLPPHQPVHCWALIKFRIYTAAKLAVATHARVILRRLAMNAVHRFFMMSGCG